MIEPETIIDGRYRVISRLGSGGMADVYLAQDQLLGREVAVKVLHHHFAEDHEFVERFRREASSAAALSHPNIVGIFDRGEWNGTYYIAMEYVAGRSLKAIVREQGPLAPAAAIDIVVQILRAARFAHRRGVIHRDLKPHNVILDEEGRARVTDFGIARALEAPERTESGTILGTGSYVAPEQAQGERVGQPADVYSLGIVLYELLAGEPPFRGSSFVETAVRHVNEAPPDVRERRPDVPPALAALVGRCLQKSPAVRPTAAEVAAELGAFVRTPAASAPVEPAPEPEDERTLVISRRPAAARRRRWPLVLLAAALVAAAALGAAALLRDDGDAGAAGTLVRVQAVATYDPLGDGTENDGEIAFATDGDATTFWSTEGYDDFAATKEGVGLVLDAGAASLRTLTERTSLPGWTAEIRTADDPAGPFERVVGEAQQTDAETTWQLGGEGTGPYLAIWITELAPEDGRDHARVDEVTARADR